MNPVDSRYSSDSYVLATGFAQLPKGTPLSEQQKVFACSLVFDQTDDRVVDASFTFLMDVTEEFLIALVVGRRLPDEWKELQQAVRERFLVPTQGAILQALRAAVDRYVETKQRAR
ncbi:DUF3870 domain-containing protein [Brevibacillus humidisoli]|uniref:DUF3870 domain-containing protein n=1 Tax=Brevibacillus humidisoli TaxID=2895522 RepID=UPI001E30392C|nr:DUF3870 domain-containing protein [Brevibacillus humidisoli]UFJ41631.1 DUF3870 domain-containing protein [Brevibacillus humidisoli]